MAITSEQLEKLVASNIKAERQRAALSQNALAKKSKVSLRYIQRLETKPKNLSLRSLLKLS